MERVYEGYARDGGSVGTRNHVAVIPTVGCVNEVARRIAEQVEGVIPLLHHQGCCQLSPDIETITRVLVGLGRNPNVAGVLLINLGCQAVNLDRVRAGIEESTETHAVSLQELGGITNTTARGVELARQMVTKLKNERSKTGLDSLVVGLKCGASGATSGVASNPAIGVAVDMLVDEGATVVFGETTEALGAEDVLSKRAASPEIARSILSKISEMEERAKSIGVDMRGSQPTPGNIRAGLTTIEDKSLGAVIKTGTRTIQGVLEYGERPQGKGLYFMDTPGREIEMLTGLAAGGCEVIVFSTGVGAPQGFPIVPVIKVSGNENTCRHLAEHIDIDVSGIVRGEQTLEEAGQRIFDEIIQVASGRQVKAERLGYDIWGVNLGIYMKGPVI